MNNIDFNILLIGFMGTGKTSVSEYLSGTYDMEEVDMDKMISQMEGMSVADIFKRYGEEYFRDCESNLLIELQNKKKTVISCGGGVVLRKENLSHMRAGGKIVLLTASPETVFERVKDCEDRPILNNNMNVHFIQELMEQRRDKYEKAADVIICTDGKTIEEIGREIITNLFV